jgi:hypothetical protein
MTAPVLRVVATDLETGESETQDIPAGEYLLLTTEPCHLASTQAYPVKGTHVLTIKGRVQR